MGQRARASKQPGAARQAEALPPAVARALVEPARPVEPAARAGLETRLGHGFGHVRVHAGPEAAASAAALDALAYTVGEDVVFGADQYRPGTAEGRELLAHELTHVVQQQSATGSPGEAHEQEARQVAESAGPARIATRTAPTIQRQRRGGRRSENASKGLNYRRARLQNSHFAGRDALGWDTKLATVAGGSYSGWASLWAAGNYNAFADQVAEYQRGLGFSRKAADGVLGLATWARIAGFGEAIAGITDVRSERAEHICTLATRERLRRAHQLAAGRALSLPEDARLSTFDTILQSIPGRMLDIDLEYRATGAAGAVVYAGLGTFVDPAAIWSGGLRPGAALQGWYHTSVYTLLRQGQTKENGKLRRINEGDIGFPAGSSMVFVRYDTESYERILVRHFGGTEWKERGSYAVWVAANPIDVLQRPPDGG